MPALRSCRQSTAAPARRDASLFFQGGGRSTHTAQRRSRGYIFTLENGLEERLGQWNSADLQHLLAILWHPTCWADGHDACSRRAIMMASTFRARQSTSYRAIRSTGDEHVPERLAMVRFALAARIVRHRGVCVGKMMIASNKK